MRRARSRALVLVNWKGVFYERYVLDEHVTALEGDNGAGKTTVMIAAYVVMLPDMTRLRFANVGESDATGGDKGIWGRLGNPNRPSYSAVEFDLGGERLLAGVQLERKGEPSVELTPFLISDLPSDVRHQDVLLLRSQDEDLVPEIQDLRETVTRLGGRIQVFRTAREYFAALFDRGVTPLRLAVDDERTRFNDMLRTSMTGGISRALTRDFRSFLLKEEGGLADTLVRMRTNLDACRRTRTEVTEARELEGEISGVYEAGHEMFAAGLMAARERAAELRKRVDEAGERRDEARRQRDGVAAELERSSARRQEAENRKRRSEEELGFARNLHERTDSAHRIARRLSDLEGEMREGEPALRDAGGREEEARRHKDRRAAERKRAEASFNDAARGLADVQRGLEELHRRADAHRTVTHRLREAAETLDVPELQGAHVDARERQTREIIGGLDRRRSELDAALSLAGEHRAEHARALAALAEVLGREADAGTAHAAARDALRRLADLEDVARRAGDLEGELEDSRAALERQRRARAAADALAEPDEPLSTSAAVRAALGRAEDQARALAERVREEASEVDACLRRRGALQAREQELGARQARWRELDSVAGRLQAALGTARRTAAELESARGVLDDERDAARRRLDDLTKARDERLGTARALERTGGVFPDDLIAARDLVGGELLAGHFDDVEPSEAARLQARLGPLAEAIVVEDGREAARMIRGHARELDTIWFVEGGGMRDLVPGEGPENRDGGKDDVVVGSDGVVRSTRLPARPTLGRKARRRLIAELDAEVEALAARIEGVEAELAETAARRRDVALLMRESVTLEAGDPALELNAVREELTETAASLDARRRAADEAGERAAERAARAEALRDLLAEAYLLDQEDQGQRVEALRGRVAEARRAGRELDRVAEAQWNLGETLDALRRPPRTDAELEASRRELAEANERRDRLYMALDALGYVASHREALAWSDAEAALSAQRELVPSLEQQRELADQAWEKAKAAAEEAEQEWEEARRARRELEDERGALEASRDRAERELAESGVEDPSAAALGRARMEVDRLGALVAELDREERALAEEVARLEERLGEREKDLATAEDSVVAVEREWGPAEELWERLRSSCEQRGLVTPAITTRLLDTGTGSVNLRSRAQEWRRALEERLSTARGGDEILGGGDAWFSGQDQTAVDDYVRLWEAVREWIRRRVPAQITEVDDPLEALERLKRHLRTLGERLDDQEAALRGASQDVARGIDVHLRSAQRQVRDLNRGLDGVRFGTIDGIRIRLTRDERMGAVLSALRQGSAQELLFVPSMPIEVALDELFTRYGGRGETVGRRLLDYREYVEIVVEVRRASGADWEAVNPSRLSTGESIGVGTALMMVVLTAWERSANLFRQKRSLGTLRLLFLDEANRLSRDNLDILFELCSVLDLQLMIASPEVARGPGCTTYRLVRRTTADGREEVLVSGRRTVAGDGARVGA